MSITYFYSLTPREFNNIQQGYNERREAESNERLILARRLMFAVLAPYKKGMTEESLWPLDIDKQHDVEARDEADMVKQLQDSIDFWARIDAARAKA